MQVSWLRMQIYSWNDKLTASAKACQVEEGLKMKLEYDCCCTSMKTVVPQQRAKTKESKIEKKS